MKNQKKYFLIGGALTLGSAFLLPKLRGNSRKEMSRLQMTMNKTPGILENLRGKHYCEIFVAYRNFNQITVGIYNNINRLPVPQNEFNNFDTEDIKKEFHAAEVIKNGPRYWVLDGILGYQSGKPEVLLGYEFDLVGTIKKSKAEFKKDAAERKPYREQTIIRYTDWLYSKGQKVYELTSDTGEVYTLQSVSLEVNPDLKISDLDGLSSKLNLPDGWSYKVNVLDKDRTYSRRGEAHVIQDDFRNTYQRNV